MSSDAVDLARISRIVGYKLIKGFFAPSSPNLPQRVLVLAEANTANQSGLDITEKQYTSAKQVGDAFGYGSPAHITARILFPKSGSGVGGVPVFYIAQAAAPASTAKTYTITPSGVASANGTHYIRIAGREGLDGSFYAVNIIKGDTNSQINDKINSAVNNIPSCPFSASDTAYVATLTSKWTGATADGLQVEMDTNGNSLGITYVVAATSTAAGIPDISAALALIQNDWVTLVLNSYGTDNNIMSTLEAFNGIADPLVPTGRFTCTIMKPLIAITGSVADNPSTITDTRLNDMTIAIAPAPNSKGLAMEAAANMLVLQANISQNTPHLDVAGLYYPDMPVGNALGSMSDYNNRDAYVKKGCSTVDLVAGVYRVMDFVTTYHKAGENPPQYAYVRNLNIDYNVRYGYYLLEQINVVDHAIAADTDVIGVSNVIKPKQWKQIVSEYAIDLGKRSLIVQPDFMINSISVTLSTSNPDRLETTFNYKRSGFVRIASTTAAAGFNFGTLN